MSGRPTKQVLNYTPDWHDRLTFLELRNIANFIFLIDFVFMFCWPNILLYAFYNAMDDYAVSCFIQFRRYAIRVKKWCGHTC